MYSYDVFISYVHDYPVGEWTAQYFRPEFEGRLAQECGHEPNVFMDVQIRSGDSWPDHLAHALLSSRLLLSVLSPGYFRSKWCMAELQTMLDRENFANRPRNDGSGGLVVPVWFSDGESFREDVRERQRADFRGLAYTGGAFRQSERFLDFTDVVTNLAKDVATRLPDTPEWDPDWPVTKPDIVSAAVSMEVPRP